MEPQSYSLEVQARLPNTLADLRPLSENLLYAWDRHIRGLFWRMDADLWERCGHNPKVFLRRISQDRLAQLAEDEAFLEEFRYVVGLFHTYRRRTRHPHGSVADQLDPDTDLIAYFCAEYGLHESLPIYSGGLGILAGDHCKAASSLGLPFVAVGLMYRQGYFRQRITREGTQQALFKPHALADLPISPVMADDDSELRIVVPVGSRQVTVGVWRAEIGHLSLLLLDTDVPENGEADRSITYQLYGGDHRMRLAQELVLGVGGVRALRALKLHPSVWHVNEGHAAFLSIERCREAVAEGLTLDTAVEVMAASTVFTTHTPVAAGHDVFERELARAHLLPFAEAMGVEVAALLALGGNGNDRDDFNMTTLALRCSRRHNAVSRIHRDVAARMEGDLWPQVPPVESPLQHVTNGVHVQTFLARQWSNLLDMHAPGWRSRLCDQKFWRDAIQRLPPQQFWALRVSLKQEMLDYVCELLCRQYRRQRLGQAHTDRRLSLLRERGGREPLTIVFARRFATYKRATLLFRDPERLARLLNNPERPVVMLFAGKAHPADRPGQELLRTVANYAERPEFVGKLFLLENYDLALSRKLVAGADVWLNTPVHPLEACGTSGQKAAINGSLNVSVLDGWWAEGYDGDNGWGISPYGAGDDAERDRYEAEDLFDLLEDEVIPLYFQVGSHGHSEGWVTRAKAAMYTVLPRFNAERMLLDYVEHLYLPASRQGRRLNAEQARRADELVVWKRRIAAAWPKLELSHIEGHRDQVDSGEDLNLSVVAHLDGLEPEDLQLECVLSRLRDGEDEEVAEDQTCYRLIATGRDDGTATYELALTVNTPGMYRYRIRAYPHHPDMAHPFETGLMRWL